MRLGIENSRGEKHSWGAWMRAAGRLAPDCLLPAPACSSVLHSAAGVAPEIRVANKILCLQSMWWSHSALETSHVRRMDECCSGGELEAQVDHAVRFGSGRGPVSPSPGRLVWSLLSCV